ncbi:hypothetical protein SAMN05660733_04701 [Lentzea albidocapillata]|uniref:Uncharacterized protein n=1 Tax=Lentzea albidocapillata TaxID=40571 RepID=A0A1W2EZJ2_9PSEU|nr:hypothetical protein SAMN05660733_04701 [Lentzea albidocapillata]
MASRTKNRKLKKAPEGNLAISSGEEFVGFRRRGRFAEGRRSIACRGLCQQVSTAFWPLKVYSSDYLLVAK